MGVATAKPNGDPTLYLNYAVFLENVRNNFILAETYYRKALSINPSHVNTLGFYGLFLQRRRQNTIAALEHLSKAAESAKKSRHAKWQKLLGQMLATEFNDWEGCRAWFDSARELRAYGSE